jgi:hypothetical protein
MMAKDGRKKRSHAELSEQLIEIREALEQRYPGLGKGYEAFLCQYRAFLKSYLQFLGADQPQAGSLAGDTRWEK